MGPRYFTRAELHEYGVIDLPSAHFGDLKQTAIHPLLSRESFPHVTAAEYAALRPGLALASAYLSSPSGWYFWQTVLYGSRTEIPDTPGWQVLEPAYPPAFTTAAEQRAFAELLVQMRSVFAFTFREKEVSAEVLDAIAKIRKERNLTGKVAPYLWGMTQAYDRTQYDPSWKHPLGRSYGGASYITLNPIFLQHAMAAAELRGGSSASVSHSQAQAVTTTAPEQPNLSLQRRPLTVQDLQKPLPDPPRPEPTSAQISLVLRQQFHFATTVLHELAHAFNNVVRHKGQVEPFWCDQRRAELGYAFEAFTHGGRLGAVHANRHCKWGMEFTGWPPGPEAMEIIGPTTKVKGEKPKYGPAGAEWNRRASRRTWITKYVVPMSHIQKVHTRRFWEVDLRRFGPAQLRLPKSFGIRYGNVKNKAGFDARSADAMSGVVFGDSKNLSGASSREWEADAEGRVRRYVINGLQLGVGS